MQMQSQAGSVSDEKMLHMGRPQVKNSCNKWLQSRGRAPISLVDQQSVYKPDQIIKDSPCPQMGLGQGQWR